MNTYEKCCAVRDALLRRIGEVIVYDNWSAEFVVEYCRGLPDDAEKFSFDVFGIQPAELTEEQCISLGFKKFSKNSAGYLIPIWLYPFLADEIHIHGIDGGQVCSKKGMDTDNRFGMLAYRIFPKGVGK